MAAADKRDGTQSGGHKTASKGLVHPTPPQPNTPHLIVPEQPTPTDFSGDQRRCVPSPTSFFFVCTLTGTQTAGTHRHTIQQQPRGGVATPVHPPHHPRFGVHTHRKHKG